MFSFEYRSARPGKTNAFSVRIAIAGIGLLAAGCSADVARFDSPAFNLTGGASSNGPTPPDSPRRSSTLGEGASSSGSTYTPPRPNREPGVQVAALPEAQRPATPPPPAAPVTQAEPRRVPAAAAHAAPAAASTAAKGEQIEVQHGDTLYGLSRKHHVSLNELMQVNALQNPSLKPGQKLYLPVARNGRGKPLIKPAVTAAAQPTPVGPVPAAPTPASTVDASTWTGSHTVKAGDSLYALSRQHKVKMADLQQVNGITDARKVKPGTVLKVPGGSAAPAPVASVPVTAPEEAAAPRVAAAPSAQPTLINGQTKVAALTDRASDATPAPEVTEEKPAAAPAAVAAATSGSKLRWPVKGKVIAGFGPRPDGTHNDGVNLAVPQGAEVHAADGGTVAYAGSELKGYGNLVLVRHDNGWVTAYAHNDEILVKRGDKVKRGQLIAKAGKSGQVDQPQVHFELRQGSKPVDPTPHMERL